MYYIKATNTDTGEVRIMRTLPFFEKERAEEFAELVLDCMNVCVKLEIVEEDDEEE